MFTTLNRITLVGGVCLLGLLVWFHHRYTEDETAIGQLTRKVSTLTTERDDARKAQALQAFHFNRMNRITGEAQRANQQTADQAEQLRHEVHNSISSQSCSAVLLPAVDSDRLLGYVSQLRQTALHPDAATGAGTHHSGAATRRLTWGQTIEWIPLLLGNIQSCNQDKAAARRIDEERASENTSTQ
ncbi:hypothetical protein ZK99_004765 [Salmonella enterica subsp. enterica]|uniref:DUF2570 domain-containing protein n=1 Tax=Salmonella enterica subsp. enterica serovar Kottbus TaxID=224727 RepID=A0A5J0SB73_SALET|nr:hypothetical protein [Salmonella enterica subsp. enterica serovar Newport]EBQ9797402.1 hypothetical protein [Salmonella enterica subsp. enterica serovar Kottbus]ECA9706480.1 hypothetical protein [Salmonella enterica subsp. enterica serovar Bredeney]EDE8444746.1 hypothetical protein [Salmonella enterica subsp. enterica serovar Pomona]EDJ1502860.1 hypothetical protein [Salmonella enterica]EDN4396915.1 hypothetical protein [Salmonella enterica subsp. enterica]HCK3133598.1 hypothetical protein